MPPSRILWTNQSVLKFAGDADPIQLIEAKARELVLRARDAGWSGPPYSPLAIADLLKIRVEANSDVVDARTVAVGSGIRIEFNPTRPRERVRFSIAHEIAHTLFPDVREQTRHRGGTGAVSDQWQLEMLCNLAAAEFVMPLGSLPPSEHLPKIEQLMSDRLKFDVSTEAFLIRVVKTTAEPVLMFCASPIEREGFRPHYRIDYSVGSKSAPAVVGAGMSIPSDSIVYGCTAIGRDKPRNRIPGSRRNRLRSSASESLAFRALVFPASRALCASGSRMQSGTISTRCMAMSLRPGATVRKSSVSW